MANEKLAEAQSIMEKYMQWESQKSQDEARLETLMIEAHTQKSQSQDVLERAKKERNAAEAATK